MAKISPFNASIPDLTDIISFDEFFESVKRKFPLYLSDGIYEQATKKAIYIYRVKRQHRSHTGLIVCTNVLDYINGSIKKHENTLTAKEAKMMRLIEERQALIKPILLTYPNVLEIDAMINRITISNQVSFSISFQEEEHLFWQITDKTIVKALCNAFEKKVAVSYICDGHHRAKTSELIYQNHQKKKASSSEDDRINFMLSAYFPASEIEIHNYNRLIANLGGLTENQFIEQLGAYYQLTKVSKSYFPNSKFEMGMFIGKQWYQLKLKKNYLPKRSTAVNETLDVHMFNELVLKGILNIEDVRTEPDIKYLEGPKGAFGLERRVREGKAAVAFNLYPVALEDLIKISDQDHCLPPKSTWIEPRMRNGFIAHLYKE
jgi:uncharacterized protein (DUF1015 family)